MTATTVTSAPPKGITARGLRKAYGGKVVLDGIDLDVPAGTVFALLGANGTGKSTTARILSTLVPADEGRVTVAGHCLEEEAAAVRAAIGFVGQRPAVDGLLTAAENVRLIADLLHLGRAEGRRRTADLLDRLDLGGVARKAVSTLSGGERRKLDLAMSLVGDPDVLFLDEPTAGLDPRSRHTMWQLLRDLVRDGTTIFLTTQYLEEADRLADRIAVLDGGDVVAEGTADELKRLVPGGHLRLRFDDIRHLEAAVRRLALSTVVRDDATLSLQVPSDGSVAALRSVLDVLEDAAVHAEALTVHTPGLDDVFLTLTDTRSRDGDPACAWRGALLQARACKS